MIQSESPILAKKPNPIVSIWRNPLVQAFLNDPITLISGTFLLVVILAVIFAPVVAPHDPLDQQPPLTPLPPVIILGSVPLRSIGIRNIYCLVSDN